MSKITSSDALDLITLSKAENKLGDIKSSLLTLEQFQSEHLGVWMLADGSSCTGTAYGTLTGATALPDMRGTVQRMKAHGSTRNPDGDLPIGTYQGDAFGSHSHGMQTPTNYSNIGYEAWFARTAGSNGVESGHATKTSGGSETRMKNVTVNFFIKVGY